MPRRGENIYKRKDGRWEGRICGADGRYQYVYAKTYREVKEKKNEYQKKAENPKKNDPPDSAVHLFECWLDGDIKGQVKPSTYDSYDCCIRKYVIPFFISTGYQHLDAASVNQLVKTIFELPGLSDSYKRKILTILKTSLKEILRETKMSPGILDAVKLTKKTSSEVQAFTMGEQRLIENAAYRSDDMRALGILLTFYTGVRLGELCTLKWNDLDYDSGTLSITKTVTRVKNLSGGENKTMLLVGSPKSHKSTRKIPLPKFLIKLFRDREPCCANQELYLISGTTSPTDPRVYEKLFKRLLTQAGVKHRKFHSIRHTFATRALELGVDIKTLSEILGHSNVSITLDVYAHSLMEQKKIAMDKLNTLHVTYMEAAPYAVKNSVINI